MAGGLARTTAFWPVRPSAGAARMSLEGRLLRFDQGPANGGAVAVCDSRDWFVFATKADGRPRKRGCAAVAVLGTDGNPF
jgi:hypothetical protein